MSSFRAASPRKPALGTLLQSSEAIGARLEEMERKIERLRALYESYFLGVERRPPQVPRQELNRLMLETQQLSIRNAALRFRFQALLQRWTLLTTYWNRTLREIESGTYRRDLQKAYRRIAARGEPLTEDDAAALGIPISRAKAFVAQQNQRWAAESPARAGAAHATTAAVAAGEAGIQVAGTVPALGAAAPSAAREKVAALPPPRPPFVSAAGSSSARPAGTTPRDEEEDDLLGRLCRAYADAHTRLGLPGPPPSDERIRAKVLPHLQRLRVAHPSARLDVNVVTQDGRLVIRAKPIK